MGGSSFFLAARRTIGADASAAGGRSIVFWPNAATDTSARPTGLDFCNSDATMPRTRLMRWTLLLDVSATWSSCR